MLPALPAASESTFEGEVGATGAITHVRSNETPGSTGNTASGNSKFNEYRDLSGSGVFGDVRLRYDSESVFGTFKASDIGYKTQQYDLEGGMWGKFKFNINYSELPHNYTENARTFYLGAGSNTLTIGTVPTATNWPTWQTFDYEIQRKTLGGNISLDLIKPFFFNISASREERSGIKPTAYGLAQGGPAIEIPEPVDYITNIINVEAGYASKPLFAAVSFMYSNFDNANPALYFTTLTPVQDALSLAPGNEYYKIAFKGNVALPLRSKLHVNLATSRTTSEANLFTQYDLAGVAQNVSLSSPVFHGKIDTTTIGAALTSNPVSWLTGKIYYKYYDKNNKSDTITTNDGGSIYQNHLFGYQKKSFGIDLGFSLPENFSLNTSYAYVNTNRERGDFPDTTDNIFSIGLKWRGVDFITPRVGYEHLSRSASHAIPTAVIAGDQATTNAIEPYVFRFDAAPKKQDTFKIGADLSPLENLTFSLAYHYKKQRFTDTILGLRNITSQEYILDAGYSIGQIAHIGAYVDYEKNHDYQYQRRFQTLANANPDGTQTNNDYNWDAFMRDATISYGINVEVFLIPKKLTLMVQHDYMNSNGSADLTYLTRAVPIGNNDTIDIGNWDDYKKASYNAKLKYSPTKNYTLTAGYAYERYKSTDAQYDGYTYVPNANAYLTGAYANPNYQAHVIFLGLSTKF